MKADPSSKRRRNVYLAVTACLLSAIIITTVVLGFTLFKPKPIIATVNSISLEEMNVGLNVARFNVDLNITLDIDVSIENPNMYGLKYSDSNAQVYYRGNFVGEVPLPAGEIVARGNSAVDVSLTIMANKLLSNTTQIFTDYVNGSLPMSTSIEISGKVNVLGFIHFPVVTKSSCDFSINVENKTIDDKDCDYKTKLN